MTFSDTMDTMDNVRKSSILSSEFFVENVAFQQAAIEEMERKSAAAQMEIISNGFVTDAAREFMQKLPSIDQFVPPLKVEELVALIEGKNQPEQSLSGQLLGFMPSQDQLTEGDK